MNFKPYKASKEDLRYALELLDPVLQKKEVSENHTKLYIEAAFHSIPYKAKKACDRIRNIYKNSLSPKLKNQCNSIYAAARSRKSPRLKRRSTASTPIKN